MTTIKAFIKRHPLLTYFALAFAVSWGGTTPGHRRTWRNPGHHGANRDAAPVSGPGDGRRPQRSRHPVDRPRPWKGGPSRVSIPVAQVAGGRSLVRGSAPDHPALGGVGTLRAFTDLHGISPRHIRIRRQGVPSAVRYRGGAGGRHLRRARLDGGRPARAEAALRWPYYRAPRGPPVG